MHDQARSPEMTAYRRTEASVPLWIWLVIGLIATFMWWGFVQQIVLGKPFGTNPAPDFLMWILLVLVGIGFPLLFGAMKLIVSITGDELIIWFRPLYRKRIALSSISKAEVVTYRPIREYWGWGIRYWPGRGWVYSLRGNRGVRVTREDGDSFLIGSDDPETLAKAINAARRSDQ